jgi:molybdenum cofactor biosynthesis enzyme MoaA
MPFEIVTRVIDVVEKSAAPVKSATVSGGEALLHPRVHDIVKALTRVSSKLTLSTNGFRLSHQVASSLVDHGVTKFRIDVDPYRLEGPHWNSAGADQARLTEVFSAASMSGVRVELNSVLTAYTSDQLKAVLMFCARRGVNIKFFERVLVGSDSLLRPAPDITRSMLERTIIDTFGPVDVTAESASGDLSYSCSEFTLRYCEFLCTYRRCDVSGTRFDPEGHVSTCINGLRSECVSSEEPIEATTEKIARAVLRGCVLTDRGRNTETVKNEEQV